MSYASVQDMIDFFGAAEMIRASTPDGAPAVAVILAPIQTALDSATAIIDSYLRSRYSVPLDIAPQEINRACCLLARYDLGLGGERGVSEQAKATRDETVSWLRQIAEGKVKLSLAEVAPGDDSYATFGTRPQVFNDQAPACDAGGGFFNSGGSGYGSFWP